MASAVEPGRAGVSVRGAALRVAVAILFALGAAVCYSIVEPVGIVMYLSYAGVGSLIVIRRPDMVIGWLLIVAGWGFAGGAARVTVTPEALMAGDLAPADALAAWINGCGWVIASAALFAVVLVFPSGTLPQGTMRWPARLALAATIVLTALIAFAPTTSIQPVGSGPIEGLPNPGAILPELAFWSWLPHSYVLYGILIAILIGGLVGLFVRFRRSTGLLRLQFRWLVAAIAVVVVATLAWVYLTLVVGAFGLALAVHAVTYPAVPIAIMVAVLRYRLFEIDRIISRTLGYAIVTATLAVVFVGVVLGLGAAMERFVTGNTIAVAGSTLLVAALFQPLRRRVQTAVDRRFNRAGYDAQRTVDAFTEQLRDRTDLESLGTDLVAVVERALEPRRADIWIRQRREA
jgi:hypothetical protein